MLTICPVRLFHVLETFIASDRTVNGPKEESKGRLIEAIQGIEDLFVCYSADTIDRIIKDLKAQSELRSFSELACAKWIKDYPTKRA